MKTTISETVRVQKKSDLHSQAVRPRHREYQTFGGPTARVHRIQMIILQGAWDAHSWNDKAVTMNRNVSRESTSEMDHQNLHFSTGEA